jgi:PAS domain S-box-containing protein
VSEPLDLLQPGAVARLRHHLRLPLNQIIGYAELVYRQAKDQGASQEMSWMEQVLESARRIGEMVSEALPASSHVGDGSIPRLQAAMQGEVARIVGAIDSFQYISQGACEIEIGRIRYAARQLSDFARIEELPPAAGSPPAVTAREAPGRVFVMPAASESAGQSARRPEVDATRILVVDDDARNRDILERHLERDRFDTTSVPDGRAALDQLRRHPFDLVLLDIFMPRMDGFEVLAAMKAAPDLREVPVIVLSAADDQENVVRSIESGADDFLAKPFDPVVLRARIGAILRRRKAELERTEISQRLESLLESSGEGIFGLDSDGVCTFVNRAAAELLQRPREGLLGLHLHDVVHHSRPDGTPYPRAECPIDAVLRTGQPRRGSDQRFFRADGSSFPIEFSAQPVRRQGTWDGMVVTFADISERKRTEEHLLQTAKLESLGVLAGGIAHDFNNILTGIVGNTALVLESLHPRDGNRGLLTQVVHSSERAADLTRQMLAFAGKGRFVLEAVDVSEAIRSIADLLQTSVPKTARLEFHLSPDLPRFSADASQIHQIVLNLVINAGEATEDRAGVIRVETEVHDLANPVAGEAAFGVLPPGRYVCVAVADNGVGMDAALRARIFDPFFSTKFMGRGLGLAAAMGIARAHRGAIRVESRPGQGSRFEVLFPV